MAQYQVTVDDDVVHGLFDGDDGMWQLVEQVVNQILEAGVGEQLKVRP